MRVHRIARTAIFLAAGVAMLLLATGPMPAHGTPQVGPLTTHTTTARWFGESHRAVASYYGPGLYGNHVACPGRGRLWPGTLGVAHRTLPCGSWVCLTAGHRHICVQVIDRGPFIQGRDFDLTAATHARLGLHCGVCAIHYTRGRR